MERTITFYGDNYANLPSELRGLFETIAPARIYTKGQMIYYQGESAECFYYLKRGQVKIFFSSQGGMEKTLTIMTGGGILGEAAFFDGMPRVSSAKAMQKSELIAINRQTLLNRFRSEPGLAMSLLKLQAQSIRMLSSQVSSITFLQADCRIAALLLQAKDNTDTVHLTHEEIGSLVGVSRVTVSKILNSFVKKGFVKTCYGSINILNTGALSVIAENY